MAIYRHGKARLFFFYFLFWFFFLCCFSFPPRDRSTAALIEALEGALEGVGREVGMIAGIGVHDVFHLFGQHRRLLFQVLLLTCFAAVGRCLGGIVLVGVADKVEDGNGVERVVMSPVGEHAGVLANFGERFFGKALGFGVELLDACFA